VTEPEPYRVEPVTRWRVRRADGTYVTDVRTRRPLEFETRELAQLFVDALPVDPFEGLDD
jgi:hypothetical protein